MKFGAIFSGLICLFMAACERGPDAIIPPPWHPASASAESAPPIDTPAILDEPVDTKSVKVREEPAKGALAPKAPSGGAHEGH